MSRLWLNASKQIDSTVDTDKFTGNSPGPLFPVDALSNYVVRGIKNRYVLCTSRWKTNDKTMVSG